MQIQPEVKRDMITYTAAAQLLGVPIGTVYAWVSQRRIPHVRLGPRLVRFQRGALERWLEERQVAALDSLPAKGARGC